MKFGWKPINNWFGFSRRERRSTFILLLIIIAVTGVRYLIPDTGETIKDITGLPPEEVESGKSLTSLQSGYNKTPQQLKFASENQKQESGKVKYLKASGQTSEKKQFSNRKISVTTKQLIDINVSDSATLVSLPGIGPVLAGRIIKYRKFLGGFATIDQLKEVYGLQEETYALISTRVSADSAIIRRININTADFKELTRLRYLDKYEITAILKYKQLKGIIGNFDELVKNKLISQEKAAKVRPYIKFRD